MYNENMLLREMRICNMKRECVIMKKKKKTGMMSNEKNLSN